MKDLFSKFGYIRQASIFRPNFGKKQVRKQEDIKKGQVLVIKCLRDYKNKNNSIWAEFRVESEPYLSRGRWFIEGTALESENEIWSNDNLKVTNNKIWLGLGDVGINSYSGLGLFWSKKTWLEFVDKPKIEKRAFLNILG